MKITRVTKSHESDIRKTLTAKKGESLEGTEKETKWEGWLWCRNKADVDGWVPKSYLEPLARLHRKGIEGPTWRRGDGAH
ncbi:MAG: SH3 domain-containing protein [Candidatus Thorarchaeota archaeon]|jgi:hypothetical protein